MTWLRSLVVALGITVMAPVASRAQAPHEPPAVKSKNGLSSLSQEIKIELNRQGRIEAAKRAAARGDILAWGQALFPQKFYRGFCDELHDYLVSIRGDERTSTEAPRGHAKTTIRCFLIPIYQALVEPSTFRHYLNVQATEKKALSINLSIRLELEENQELRALYGDQISKTKWTDQQFALNNGVVFTAVGASGSIRGINYRNIRPDYILVDDLYDEEDINNPESTIKKNEWFWSSLYPARARGRRTSVSILGTACNKFDLMESLRGNANWKSRTFRAVKAPGVLLWPQMQTYEEFVADTQDMPTVIFNRELQNERRDSTASLVHEEWLIGPDYTWEFDPDTLKMGDRHHLEAVIIGVDPSVGKKAELKKRKESDYTGIVLAWKVRVTDERLPHYYVMDLVEERLSIDKRVDKVQEVADRSKERVTECRIEGIGGFADFAAEVRRRCTVPVVEISHVTDKITHLENKSSFFEKRRVHVSSKIDKHLRDRLYEQLTNNFPRHDDVRDAMLHVLDADPSNWAAWV